jgi:hypothetical protein
VGVTMDGDVIVIVDVNGLFWKTWPRMEQEVANL